MNWADENEIEEQVPTKCEICGRQDDTVRYVTYPFVFSFVVLTFQRAYTGCWCRTHRIQRWLAASFITSIFGWLGIPFGIILSPVRLLELARGGLQDNALNSRILHLIGEKKIQSGDSQGAIRCLETSLLYADNDGVNEQLRILYRSRPSNTEASNTGLPGLFLFPVISVGFAILGLIVGTVTNIIGFASSFLPQELSIFVIILLQVPFVILVYFCAVLLKYVFQTVVRLTRISSTIFLSVAGLITTVLFLLGVASGSTLVIYINYFINGIREMPDEIPATLVAILTRSIAYIFSPLSFENNFSGNALFAVLLVITLLLFILTLIPRIKILAVQQARISLLQNSKDLSGQSFPMLGWVGLFSVALVYAFMFVAVPQKSSIDALEAFDHTGIGYNYQSLLQPEQAITEFQLAIELRPNFTIAHILLGNTYLSLGKADDAHETFSAASTLEPYNPVPHNGIGWAYFQQGDYGSAGNEFREALHLDSQNIEAHLGMGLVYLNQLNLEESRMELQGVIAVSPDIPDAHFGLGMLHFVTGNYDDAVKSFDAVLNLNPNFVDAYVYKGGIHLRQDRYLDAEEAYNAALNIQSDNYDALSGLGDIKSAVYYFEGSLEYYDDAIASNPDRVDAYIDKAGVLAQMGEFDDAISLLKPFINKDARVQPTISYLYFLNDDEENGDKFLQDSILFVADLNDIEKEHGYMSISAVEYSLNRFQDAERHAELAKDFFPIDLDAESYFYLARLYTAMGDYDSAEDAIRMGGAIGHSDVSLHFSKAWLAINKGELDDAQNELESALKINKNSNAHAVLSFIHYQNNDLSRAFVEARSALNINPYNSYGHTRLAFVYYAQGNVDFAIREATHAISLNRLEDTSHYILGVCYMETGNTEDAIHEFEEFLDLYWDRAYIRDYKANAEEYLQQLREAQ